MGNKTSSLSLEFRLSLASTAAIAATAWGFFYKLESERLRRALLQSSTLTPPSNENTRPQKVVLIYFDIPGKGECIRLALKHGNIPFEDRRVKKFDDEQLKSTLTFGQLPCLRLEEGTNEEVSICQSAAILRYIGTFTGLYPKDAAVAALVDSIMDFEGDAFQGFRTVRYNYRFGLDVDGADEEYFARCKAKQNKEIIPAQLKKLECVLEQSSTGWLADTQEPTIADFFWVPTLQSLIRSDNPWTGNANILLPFPHILGLIEKFEGMTQ